MEEGGGWGRPAMDGGWWRRAAGHGQRGGGRLAMGGGRPAMDRGRSQRRKAIHGCRMEVAEEGWPWMEGGGGGKSAMDEVGDGWRQIHTED